MREKNLFSPPGGNSHLGVEALLNHLDDIVELCELLLLLVGLAQADADLLGDVDAEGVEDVAQVEQVELALAVPVVQVADALDL